jgi:RNA polymerase sigma-70 factor, ECF subfamily
VRTLYLEHGRYLLAVATRALGGDRAAAEDVVQETLLRAWRHADRLTEDRGSVRGWLLTVTRNLIIDRRRAQAIRPAEVATVDERLPETPAQQAPDHAEQVATAVTVAAALTTLSDDHRAALVETYLRGRTAAEAGEILGVPAGTIKSRVHYALRELRTTLTSPAEVTP